MEPYKTYNGAVNNLHTKNSIINLSLGIKSTSESTRRKECPRSTIKIIEKFIQS